MVTKREKQRQARDSQRYRDKIKILREFGFINIDLRKNISLDAKELINELLTEHAVIVKHKNDYVKRKVSDKTKITWQEQGLIASAKYLIIPKKGYSKISVRGGKLTRSDVTETHNKPVIKKEVNYALKGDSLNTKLKKLFKAHQSRKDNSTFMIRIGNHSPFMTRFKSLTQLTHYLTQWIPTGGKWTKEQLINMMSIVSETAL